MGCNMLDLNLVERVAGLISRNALKMGISKILY